VKDLVLGRANNVRILGLQTTKTHGF